MKRREADFTMHDLPRNRRELFFDVIAHHWKGLLLLGCMLALFFLPVFADLFLCDSIAYALARDGKATESNLFLLQLIKHGALIPCLALFSLSIAGAYRAIRSMAFGEGSFPIHDFFLGIKQGWGNALLTFFVLGVLEFLCSLLLNAKSDLPDVVLYLPLAILCLFFAPWGLVGMSYGTLYEGGIGERFKNTGYLFVRHILGFLASSLLCFAPVLLNLIPVYWIADASLVLAQVFVLPFGLLLHFLYSARVYDLHINASSYPSLYRKGLAPETKESSEPQ